MHLYPYTDMHELNDDWIIGQTKKNEQDISALQNSVANMNYEFDLKADKTTTYTKTEVNTLLADKADITSLATVATTGNYNDLNNKPTIPAAQVNSDWNAISGVAQILNKPTLATVATSGNYNDLSNTPTIPAAQVNSDWSALSGVAQILNKPSIYTQGQIDTMFGNLAAVARSGDYSDLINEPAYTSRTSIEGNIAYFVGSSQNKLYYARIGDIVVYTGRFTTTAEKPAGQSNFLFSGLPVPVTIAACNSWDTNYQFIINTNGFFTSNLSIPADTYNVSGCYITQ